MLQFAVPFSKQHKSINRTQRIQKEFVGDVLPTHYQVKIGREWENVPNHFQVVAREKESKHTKPHKQKFTHHQNNKSTVKPKHKAPPHIKHIASDENNAAHFARLEEEKAKERERIKEENLFRFQQNIKERVVRSERERRAAEFQKQVLIEQEIQRRAGHPNWERIGANTNDSVLYDELLNQKNAEIDDVSLTFINENNPSNANYISAHDGSVILHHTANSESLIDREVGDLFQTTQKAREALASCSLPSGPPNSDMSVSFDRSESNNRETYGSKMAKEDKNYGVSSDKVVSLDDLNKVKLYRDVRNATLQREREKVRKILIQKEQNDIFKKMQEEEAKQIERDNLLKEQERLIQEMERNVLEEQERTKKEMQLADQKKKQIMAVNKERESERYEKALKFKFLDRLTSKHVPYPCQCSRRDPINHNTENCANNCQFYQNQKRYKAALVTLLQIEQIEGIRV